jgi:uncharacterized membrane protein YeaQ/YmgE (transglycosylase-associated protein family)
VTRIEAMDFGPLSGRPRGAYRQGMTSEMFLLSIVVGLFLGWLFNTVVMKHGGYGLFGDLALGLAGSTAAVVICQVIGLASYAGRVGVLTAAFVGAVALIVLQRQVWTVPAPRGAR